MNVFYFTVVFLVPLVILNGLMVVLHGFRILFINETPEDDPRSKTHVITFGMFLINLCWLCGAVVTCLEVLE